ncbi:MAG: adenylosuccinate synthase [Chloroflexota bacterium]|nr:adenylosuccinate synthase [Chloroflexota bacterium]
MPATILVGLQWGDEGKGRVADWLAAESQIVARYAGGDNAGHTVYVGTRVYKLHLIPSGILQPGVICILGNGMVINPVNLVREIDELTTAGVDITPKRLWISSKAHIITPAHIALDKASEKARGKDAIGTTLRGIGPAYLDKTGRQGIRAGAMLDPEAFGDSLMEQVERANVQVLAAGLDPHAAAAEYVEAARRLRDYIRDTVVSINALLDAGQRALCEGAQGTMLDIDHGDYPFVTSSSSTVGGALIGLGIGAKHVDRVVGVAKAFSTRVGAGPFPTELNDEIGDRLRGTGENFWDEYGTTTGRPRRTGWLDLVVLRYACMVNGVTELVLTKLDILSEFETLKIAHHYSGVDVYDPPSDPSQIVPPTYTDYPGWMEDIGGVRQWDALPENARRYIDAIQAALGVPINTVSVGPERDQLVHR